MSEELTSYEELLEKELETLNTARRIEELLNNLNLGYKESLDALANLKQEIEGKIASFDEGTADLAEKLETAKREIDEAMAKIEEIKPKIEQVSNLAQSAETSLERLEEINKNVIQLEQSIKEAVASIDLDEVRSVGEEIKNELIKALTTESQAILEQLAYQVKEAKLGLETLINSAASDLAKNANAIKEQTLYELQEKTSEMEALGKYSLEQIEKAKKDALDAIGEQSGTGLTAILEKYTELLLYAKVVLNRVMIQRDRYNRIGMEAVFHTNSYPSSYVPLGAKLSVKDYPILYKKSGVKAVDGEFTIGLPKENTYIYTGKGA